MSNRLIAIDNGYEGSTTFEGYTIIAQPLSSFDKAGREARVFYKKGDTATDYGSHTIALAKSESLGTYQGGSQLYLLVSHGTGREVWAVPSFYDGGEYERFLLDMPERLQYAALYTLYKMASDSRCEGVEITTAKYNKAFVEGRIKKKSPETRVCESEHCIMKLLQRDRRALERTLSQLKRAQAYLLKPSTRVCATKDRATTTLDFTNAQGQVCTSVDKQIGSELALLHSAVSELERALYGSPQP